MGEYAEMELARTFDGEWEWTRKPLDYSTWVCRDGTRVKVCDMTDSHLENTLNMLMRNNKALGWQAHLLLEKMRRKELKRKENP